MPQPTITAKTARFGGLALPATGAVQSFINLNDCQQWFLHLTGKSGQFGLADSNRQIGVAPLRWRGRGVYLSDDFGVRVITLPERYYEGTELGGAGNPLAQGIAQLSQAGEQYLTFDNKTFIRVKLRKVNNRVLDRGFTPYWWSLNLEFMARDPWARDFQASGSLANLLNPNGGFEGAVVQPTLYGSTIVQSNDFETAPTTVDYFHSIGTEALGTLAAWTTLNGVPTITANVVTMPTNVGMRAGHSDWGDGTYFVRFRWDTGTVPYVGIHNSGGVQGGAGTNEVRCTVDGGTLYLVKDVAGVATIVASAACVLTTGTWYWFKIVATGTTYSVQIFTDSPAGTMSATQVGTTQSGVIADAALQNGPMLLGNQNAASASSLFGGAFANVCYVTGPAPTGCVPVLASGSWGLSNEPAFCWSKKQAYYGSACLSFAYTASAVAGVGWQLPSVAISGTQQWSVRYQQPTTMALQLNDYGIATVANAPAGATSGWGTNPISGSYTRTGTAIIGLQTGAAGGTGTAYFDYATVVQPNTPTNILFSSLGASAFGWTPTGTLAAWTTQPGSAAASIAAGVMTTAPGTNIYTAAHPDLTDYSDIARMQAPSANSTENDYLFRFKDANNYAYFYMAVDGSGNASSGGWNVIAGVGGGVALTGTAFTPNKGSWYWIQPSFAGTALTIKVYKDAGGFPGDLVTTLTATYSAITSGQVGIRANGPQNVGGNYPGTFLVQGPVPTGWTPTWVAGEPSFCLSKNAPRDGTYAASTFCNDAGSTGDWMKSFTAAAATYNVQGYLKATGAGAASLSLAGSGSQSVTQDGTWRQTTDTHVALAAGSSNVRARMAGVGTAYFDDLWLQQSLDSLTGLYSQAFQDQVALAGSTGAGTTTTTTINYPGGVWAEPLYQVTIPATNGAAISSITIVNQTTGVGLTFNFTTALAASLAQNFQVDCAAITASIGSTQYDWTAPNGAKCGFPFLYPGNNSIAVTIVTTSGTTTGVALDTSWVNRWEL